MQRGVPGNHFILGNAQQYSDINFLDISRWGQDRIDLFPYFCGDVLYDVPPTHGGQTFFITFELFVCITSFYFSLPVILTPHLSNYDEFMQLQIPNARKKYCEIFPAYTKTPHNTTHKIKNI